ncbi:hypothetical protein [Saccharospirillum sp.]|uniref:hypothetical protein n=1 Tax=Saccharospirillum sp. TaxID=2033801 RepID=UPI0034A09F75
MTDQRSTFSLIGDRYLDTQHDAQYIDNLERELKLRGVVGLKRVAFEYVAASSLWWNVFWWEWCDLNEQDVKLGWVQNLILFGLAALIAGLVGSALISVGCVLAVHAVTLRMGLGLRSGTKLNK